MTQAFTVIHLAAWLDLIEQARRFKNPKVTDPARLKAAGNAAARTILPPRYQNVRGSCFHRLQRIARTAAHYDDRERKALLEDTLACIEHLVERATSLGRLQDFLANLADTNFQQFRLELTNLMFPAPAPRHQPRFRADIDA